MSLRKKLTGLAFMVACCFGKSVHAGFWDSSWPPSPNVTSSEFNMTSLGVGRDLPSKMTDLNFYIQLAEKLWQQAYANSGSSAESFQILEAPLRGALIQCLIQAQLPQDQSGQTPDEIAHAQFIVIQIQRALEVLSEQVQRGIDPDNAQKARQVIVNLTQEAQNQLDQIAQEPSANAQLKAQWQELVEQSYQAFRDHQAITQALRNQAVSPKATAEDWYRYAMHLWTDKACLKTDEDNEDIVKQHFFKAAREGHLDAAFKLLEIYQPQVVSTDPGDVFFKLSQLQINGQSPFQPQVCIHFLARAILALNRSALAYLNSKIQADIQQGVRRKPDDTRWQAWVALRSALKKLATAEKRQAEMNALINDVNDMYQEKNGKRKLALLSQMDDFPQSESDEESAPPPALEQVKVLEDENKWLTEALQQAQAMSEKLAQEKQALVTQLEIDTSERSQQAEQLQASQNQCQTLIEEIKASQAELSQKKDELLQRQNSRKLTEQQLQQSHQRKLEAQLEQLQQAQRQKSQEIAFLQKTLSKEKSAPKTSKHESWAQPSEAKPMVPPTLKPISKKDISQRDKPGLVEAPFAAHWLPKGFQALPGSQDRNSADYNNFWHPIAGVHVGIAPFVYRVGANARADLFEEYDVHALEVRDLSTYLAGVEASERSGLIARLAQGQPGPEGWQLPRAFVNAGEIQGFLMQKYLASRHENGRSVTAAEGTRPLRLIDAIGMPDCQGELADAYVLAKQTSEVHQAASVFQYSALAMLALAQAQATGADPATWHSHNDQANGVMGLGRLWEAAGGVTSDDRGNLYVLGRDVDYTELTRDSAFGSAKALQERGDEAVVCPDWESVRLTGDFPLFSGDATFDALGLPKSTQAQGKPWRGYGNSRLYLYPLPNLMPVVGDWGSGGVVAGLCARSWDISWSIRSVYVGLRLSAYGLTWTELAGASGGFGGLPDDQAVKSREDKNQRKGVLGRVKGTFGWGKEEAAQETLSKEKSAPKTSKRESWAQPSEGKPMVPPTLKPISKKDISQRDKPGLVEAPFAAHWLPEGFEALAGSQDRDSAEYNNFWHPIAGVHVGIAPFVYRVGAKARADLFEEYDVHALEVRDLSTYLAGIEAAERAGVLKALAQGQPGPEGWQLPRAFVNAGEIQGFLMQKYLASRHENGGSVTAAEGTEPLRLTRFGSGLTQSAQMPGCQGELADAYVLAKQTSEVHQAASVFQYSALAMLALAQAQATGADPATWHSHNDRANGVMGLGRLWEAAGGVTSDDHRNLYVLGRRADYTELTKGTAFGSAKALQERGYEAVVWPDWQQAELSGDFPLFSGDATFDALGLPKSTQAQGKPWRGYGNSELYLYPLPNLMPVVGDWGSGGVVTGLCARTWARDCAHGRIAGHRLSAYGLTWTELAGASAGFGELPDDQAVKSREDKNQRSELGEALQPVAERTLAEPEKDSTAKEEVAQETLSKEKSAPKTSKHESWAQPSEAKPMVPLTLKPISKKDISQFGEPGLVEAPFAAHWLPEGFQALAGSQDRDSAQYNNFWHPIAGLHVGIAPFVYRVGAKARSDLFEKYDVHALEVRDLSTYLAGVEASERSGLIARLAQGQPGPENWQLPRAFVNAGEIQGFLMQKYLASRHENGRSVTAAEGTEPLRLIDAIGMHKDCRGELADAYVLAKQTSEVHQVASVFQYSALAMLALAQAQATGADPATWHSHNDQANGIMGLGHLWEAACGVTTASDDRGNLYVLGRRVDYTKLTKDRAFGSAEVLRAHEYEAVVCPDWQSVRLTGDFPLFSGDATFDALGLPKSTQAQGKPWRGYGNSGLSLPRGLPKLMPVVGGYGLESVVAGLCARSWRDCWTTRSRYFGLRLATYGLTWTELAGASAGSGDG